MSEPIEEPTKLTDEEVISYLRLDPNFFQRHANVLSELNLPHESGAAVSLIERQISILRERNMNMRRRMNELVETADDLNSYLSTCGGWQRDATYRFTADDWNVPQYVYLYAHNDKDAAAGASRHVDVGGNDGAATCTGTATDDTTCSLPRFCQRPANQFCLKLTHEQRSRLSHLKVTACTTGN